MDVYTMVLMLREETNKYISVNPEIMILLY